MANTKITSRVIADDAVTTAAIADDAVVTVSIADDAITSALVADNAIGIPALAVSDGSDGQFLKTNGSGTLAFADAASSLVPLRTTLGELTSVNDYSKKYHHEQNPGRADTEPINDCELQGYVRRTLLIVGGY